MPMWERKVGRYVPWMLSHCLFVGEACDGESVLSIFCLAIDLNAKTVLSCFRGL